MPSSTRQTTPGPSSTPVESRDYLLSTSNAKKRTGSEDVEGNRHNKKIKVDGEPLSNLSMNAKDKRKKKKKKKKRISVVVPDVGPKERVVSKSRTPSNKPDSVKKETVTDGPVNHTKHVVQDKEPPPKPTNKGKGKARSNSPTSQVPASAYSGVAVASGSGFSTVILSDSIDHASEILRLKEQLASQDILLQKHKAHLTQHQQALICQICLDLMHKPFALAPCGHITCYDCLIRWFTALQNPNAAGVANNNANASPETVDELHLIVNSAEARRGTYLRRRKTCPVCRAVVLQRPVEMWGIKAMVATLIKSELTDLPVPVAPSNSTTPGGVNNNGDANSDPWQHIFQSINNAMQGPLVHDQAGREHMGMYDNEDGGIYRCVDCLHEIWGGVCSGCNRGYPGHERDDDDDDDLDEVNYLFRRGLRRQLVQALHDGEVDDDDDDDDEEEGYDQFWDEGDEDLPHVNLHHQMHEYLFPSGDEGMTDSEGEGGDLQNFENFDPLRSAFRDPPAPRGIARIDEDFDEEHESDCGGSFIDDNEEEGEIVDDGPEVIELDASSDEEHTHPRRLPQTRIQQRRRPLVTSEDEENSVHLGTRTGTGSRHLARRHATVLLTDDSRTSGGDLDDDEELTGEEDDQRGVLARSRARSRMRVMSDDE